ncbi:hypothetical protein Tco_1292252 [Tanacetum coccineum]
MPTGKIGVYTRFFEFANFRLPLSTFLVDILRYYRIHLSQLSVIAAAKVSHFEILCRVHNIEPTVGLFRCFYVNSKNKGWMSFSKRPDVEGICYSKPIDSLKHWNDHFFWVDSFACPTSFRWHTDKNVSKDPFPKSTEFNAEHYAILVRLLDSTVGHVVPLLPVAPARVESELEASVDKLFDEGGSAKQGDSAAGGGHDAEVELVTATEDTTAGDHGTSSRVVMGGKSPSVIRELLASSLLNAEAGVEVVATLPFVTSSVSATPVREGDNPTDSVTGANLRTIGPAQRFVISPDSSHHSSTHASGAEVASVIRSAAPPPVITEAMITSATAGIPSAPVPETSAKVNTPVHASMFHDSDSVGTVKPDVAGPSHLPGKELSLGSREFGISSLLHQVITAIADRIRDNGTSQSKQNSQSSSTTFIYKTLIIPSFLDSCFISSTVSEDKRAMLRLEFKICALDKNFSNDLDTSREFIDHLAPPVLFSQIRDMDYEQLFTEFNVGTARQVCLNAEVRMRTEYYLSERKRLESECGRQADLLKSSDKEVEDLKAQLLLKEAERAEATRLRTQVSFIEAAEKVHVDELNVLKQKNAALEDEKNYLNGKVTELQSSVSTKDLELKDLNAALSSLQSQNDGLVDQVHKTTCSGLRERLSGYENLTERLEEFQDAQLKVVNDKVAKLVVDLAEMVCHLEENFYPHLLTTISGRRWLLTHGLKLVLVKCLNSSEYLTALGAAISRAIEKGMQDGLTARIDHGREGRKLCEVDFPLLAELKSHKDASVEDIMNLLRMEGPLADVPGMSDLQPDIEQLRVPIYMFDDQVVLWETSLSFSLSVSHTRVGRIKANIAAEWSALLDVWTSLSDPLSVQSLIGAASTSASIPAATVTTMALSTTFASASSIPPITVDDYEIAHADG